MRKRRTVNYPWMPRQRSTDEPVPEVLYTCDRCGHTRARSEFVGYFEYELRGVGLLRLQDGRLGYYFVCKEGCNGLDKV